MRSRSLRDGMPLSGCREAFTPTGVSLLMVFKVKVQPRRIQSSRRINDMTKAPHFLVPVMSQLTFEEMGKALHHKFCNSE
ncbi:hypothetical protein NDU88_005088 [Pleurodeles waltl]|uniref:Uncharacterized protein n=1 Tax=Pleurodeles waltl TaxID=8319 RepID=A0AAV7M9I5_PLEWA|nr:hypothetical protein NDU88_005088 [Pleurodeles waltl]